jgi:hypothetical protein
MPRYHLPDDWSGKGTCPGCGTPGRLSVQHQDVTPDRMVCGACGTAFELETAGTRIRLAVAPPALAARTAGLLDAWLTPADFLRLLERAAPADSPFEPLPASAAVVSPAATSVAQTPTAPLNPKSAAPAGADPQPGTEDWFASLAAVIGGTSTIKPPPDAVLADELEWALLNRPGYGANGGTTTAVVANDSKAAFPAAPPAAPAPSLAPALVPTPAAPEPVKLAESKSANVVLAEAIAALAVGNAPAAPAVSAPPLSEPAPSSTPALATPPTVETLPAEPPAASGATSLKPAAPAGGTPPANAATGLVPAGAGAATPAESSALPNTASRRDLAERAWKLHELGNSLASIRGALESSGGTPDDIGIIMAKLDALEQARHERFRRTVRRALAAALLVVFVLLVTAIVLGSLNTSPPLAVRATAPASQGTPGPNSSGASGTPAPGQTEPAATLVYNPIIALINQLIPGDVKLANGPTPTPAPNSSVLGVLFPATATATLSAQDLATEGARKSSLPSWAATLVPNGVTLLNVPTPAVDASGPPNSPCPATVQQASALFGGPAGDWAFNHNQHGWIFALADKPTSIRIPANMTAGYLVIGQNLEMRSVAGPATLRNVNFVAVSCP